MRNLTATLCLTLVLFLGSAGVSWGAKSNNFINYFPGYQKFTEYIGDYAKAETKETATGISYPTDAALALRWMMGYMTGINEMEEDKEDFFRMKFSEVASLDCVLVPRQPIR